MVGYFPELYPDELIYSGIARMCSHLQIPDHRPIAHRLFGVRETSTLVDLPRNIACLVKTLQLDSCFSIKELIWRHTLLPLYTPFLPPSRLNDLHQSILAGSSTSTHLKSGNHPHPDFLRFCPVCKELDVKDFGETYWHRLHQITGAEVCPKHLVFLESSCVPRSIRSRANAFFAAESVLPIVDPRPIQSDAETQLLMRLASGFEWLLAHPDLNIGPTELRDFYLGMLIRAGFATCNGRLYVSEFLTAFRARYSPALLKRLHCELDGEGRLPWIVRLFHSPRGSQAPVRQALLMDFFGESFSKLFSDETNKGHMRHELFGTGPWPCINPVCQNYRREAITTVEVVHYKQRGCSCGIFTCPNCKLVYRRFDTGEASDFASMRTIKYGPIWEHALEEMWANPMLSIRAIADILKVDPITVKRKAVKLGCVLQRQATEAEFFGPHPEYPITLDADGRVATGF